MKYIISVTAEDIAKGLRGCEFSCPVALALTREFPKVDDIRVDEIDITFDDRLVRTPTRAAEFVAAFDRSELVEPFEFEIDLKP